MSALNNQQKARNSLAGKAPAQNLQRHNSRKVETALGRALVIGAVLTAASQANAIPMAANATPIIYYTFTGIGSGTLNGQSFVNASFTITADAMPSQITSPMANVFSVSDISSSISI